MYDNSVAASDRMKKTPKPKSFAGSCQSEDVRLHEEPEEEEAESSQDNSDRNHSNFGDEIENFFTKTTTETGKADCSDLDFDSLIVETDNTLVHARKAVSKVTNRRQRGAKNPVKKLAERTDLKDPDLIQNKTRRISRDGTKYNSRYSSKG